MSLLPDVDSLWITCTLLVDTPLLRCGMFPNRLAGEQSARRKVVLEPPLFAAQATKRMQRILSYPQWPLAVAFVERHAAQWHL